MQADDAERQQHGAGEMIALAVAARGRPQRGGAEADAEHDRGDDQIGRPHDLPGNLQAGHAEKMHQHDADADDGAADRGARVARAVKRPGKAERN